MKSEEASHGTRISNLCSGLGWIDHSYRNHRFLGRDGPGRLAILSALLIAGTKSGLVLNYFMHLKSERLLIFKVIIPLVMAVFLVFIILTFSDVAFRGGVK